MFIDTHAHLTFDVLANDIEGVLGRAQNAKVSKIINVCTNEKELEQGILWKKKIPWLYNAAATTPHDVAKEQFFPQTDTLVAIGEIGLDYYYMHSPKNLQQEYFKKSLELARKANLPVIIHCRDAFDDLFDIMDKNTAGVLHCFTGSIKDAEKALERGLFISFSGIITFKNSQSLRDIAKIVPLEFCLIETDAPYLAPQIKRGKINEPAYVIEVAKTLAHIHGVSIEKIAEITTQNAQNLFGI